MCAKAMDDAWLLERVVEALPDMIFIKDAENLRFVRLNRAAEELLGWQKDSLIGRSDRDLFPAQEAEFFVGKDREVLQGGKLMEIAEEPIHTALGLKWLHTKKIPILGESGNPLFLLGISRDVTDLRQARIELEDREARLSLLLSHFPGILWTVDQSLEVLGFAGARVAALKLEQPGPRSLSWLPPPVGPDSIETLHRRALAGERVSFEMRGGGFELEARLERMRSPDQVRVVGVALDVTERRRLEAERLEARLQRAQRLESLGVLAGGIAHDFNNLLVGILGHASLALAKLEPDSGVRDDIDRLRRAAERASELTRQMLAYSGKGRFVVEAIDLSATVHDMADLLGASVSKHARIDLRLEPNLPRVQADVAQIRQLVMNLLTNASDALEGRQGNIRVSTGVIPPSDPSLASVLPEDAPRTRPYVSLEVEDDGCGMDDRTQARMFDPFFSTKQKGQGLGLAAALGIIRGHRGTVSVSSQPGLGTRVRVLFPTTDLAPNVSAEPTPSTKPSGHHGIVLVIDDDEMVRSFATAALKHAGYLVLVADTAECGLELFSAQHEDIRLVILDLTMPGMSGRAAFPELRRIDANVPVVLSSGYDEAEATQELLELGLAGFLQKPYQLHELLSIVQRHARSA